MNKLPNYETKKKNVEQNWEDFLSNVKNRETLRKFWGKIYDNFCEWRPMAFVSNHVCRKFFQHLLK